MAIETSTLFKITADYRPHNEHKPTYYVMAPDKKTARAIFNRGMDYMKIYSIEPCDDETYNKIMETPRYYLLNRQDEYVHYPSPKVIWCD